MFPLFVITIILTDIVFAVNYTIRASNYTSPSFLSCSQATNKDICIFYCDSATEMISFDCGNAGKCIVYCTQNECMLYGELIATNSNNGGLIFDSTNGGGSCLKFGLIYLPNSDNAILLSGDSSLSNTKIFSGLNTKNISIDCSLSFGDGDCNKMIVNTPNSQTISINCNGLNYPGSNDCAEMTVNAQNASRLTINAQDGKLDGNPGSPVIINCPQNNHITSCIIDATANGDLEYVTINTVHGIPVDLIIYADADDNVNNLRVTSIDPICDETRNTLFDDTSNCWNTPYPTNAPTQPTSQPTTSQPATSEQTTSEPTTSKPTTDPTTSKPTTSKPTTSDPTNSKPTTSEPNTQTNHPTQPLSNAPTSMPTKVTSHPTVGPTQSPSDYPLMEPSLSPTMIPSDNTTIPTVAPSELPIYPSRNPTNATSNFPSDMSSFTPSASPFNAPSYSPIIQPTMSPSDAPSLFPTASPSVVPTSPPTSVPSSAPSSSPTFCFDYSHNSNDGNDLIFNIPITINIDVGSETIQYYKPDKNETFIDCNDDTGNEICYIHCIQRDSCSLMEIVPHNEYNYLSQLIIKCDSSTSCEYLYVNISKYMIIDNITIICDDAFSCDSLEIDTHPFNYGLLSILCTKSHSCNHMIINIDTIDNYKFFLNYTTSIYCFDTYSCDYVQISVYDNITVQLNMIMYKYSSHINVKYNQPDNINLTCGNNRDKLYIAYDNQELLNQQQIIFLAQLEYDSKRLPCEDITIDCTSNVDFPQKCKYKYDVEYNIDKVIQSRTYATCLWFELNSLLSIECNGNCGDFTEYYNHNISMGFTFNFNNDGIMNDSVICDEYFGINRTESTLNSIDVIISSLLSLYNPSSIKQITSSPQTTLQTEASYLNCDANIDLNTRLVTIFEVQSIVEDVKSIEELFDQDSEFYNHTVLLLNKYFGADIFYINNTKTKILETPGIISQLFNESYSSYYFGIILVFTLILIIIFGCIHQKCSSKSCSKNRRLYKEPYHSTDDLKVLKILSFGLQILDVYTDIVFIYDILMISKSNLNVITSTISLSFLVIPYIINITLLFTLKNNKKLNTVIKEEWIQLINIKLFMFFMILSGSFYHTLCLSASKLFGLKQFSAPFHFGDFSILLSYKFKYITILETMPQIIIQTIWLVLSPGYQDGRGLRIPSFVILSITMSLINLVTSIFEYFYYININKNQLDKINSFQITYLINSNKSNTINNDIQKIKWKLNHYFGLKIRMSIFFSAVLKHCDIVKVQFDEKINELFIQGVVLKLINHDHKQLYARSISTDIFSINQQDIHHLTTKLTDFYGITSDVLCLQLIKINGDIIYAKTVDIKESINDDKENMIEMVQSQIMTNTTNAEKIKLIEGGLYESARIKPNNDDSSYSDNESSESDNNFKKVSPLKYEKI